MGAPLKLAFSDMNSFFYLIYDDVLVRFSVCSCCRQAHVGEPIPTLHEAVELCKELDLLMFLELKEKATKVISWVCDLL